MMRPRSWYRSLLTLGLLSAFLAVGCSVGQAMPLPDCVEGGSGLIVAQSVPGAELVPCLDQLPPGWSKSTVDVDQNGTVMTFDSDRAGVGAARLHYMGQCEVGEAVLVPSDLEQTARFDQPERLEPGFREKRYYVFLGGCLWWEFDFDDGVRASLSIELADRLELITRDELNRSIAETFIDEEL